MRKVDGLLLDPDEVEFLAGMLARATEVMPARWSPAATITIARISDAAARFASQNQSVNVTKQAIGAGGDQHRPRDLLDSTEAAKILGISPHAVRALARRGRLPAYRAGGRWLLPAVDVIRRAER